jgi:hypothetical protein
MTGAHRAWKRNPTGLLPPALLSCLIHACSPPGGPNQPVPLPPDAAAPGPRPDGAAGGADLSPPISSDAKPPVEAGGGSDASPAVTDTAPSAECTPASSVLCMPLAPLPMSLRDTGIFPSFPNVDVLAPNVHAFVPGVQLWSNGLHKKRQVILPKGQKVDTSTREAWVFPTGTIFVKTFLSDGPPAMKPIETRIIRRTDNPDPFEQYKFDVYKWNDAGTEATLINIDDRTPVSVMVGGRSFMHQIPSREDCKKCHGTNDTVVIGFDEIRLNAPLAAGGKMQLETFAAAGFFSRSPPSPVAQITDPDPMTQAVKRYVYGNCYHCHNGNDSTAFAMPPDDFVMAVVRQPTMGSGTAPGTRVVPGNPNMSVFYRQMTRMNLMMGYNPMPPVGVEVADPDALTLVRQWIMSLR